MMQGCTYEAAVARAASTGDWSNELRAHVEQCALCGEVALVAGVLGSERRQPPPGDVADFGQVWWMAQLRARRAAAERATLPIAVVEAVAVAAVAVLGSLAAGRLVASMTPWSWAARDGVTAFLGGGVWVLLAGVVLGTLVLGLFLQLFGAPVTPSRD